MKRRTFLSRGGAAALAAPALGLTATPRSGMFVHCVYFWLRDDLTDAQVAAFVAGLHSLAGIDAVASGYVGTPASTDRAIIDRSYSYALVLAFDDPAAHDVYQAHPVHEEFRQATTGFWSDITIYDMLTV